MLYQRTSGDVMIKDYAIPFAFAGSSRTEQTDMSAIWDEAVFICEAKELPITASFYHSLLGLFEIDLSSVCPYFEPITGTSLFEGLHEEIPFEEELESDVVVRMQPVRRYSVRARITSVERARPRVVEPEGF